MSQRCEFCLQRLDRCFCGPVQDVDLDVPPDEEQAANGGSSAAEADRR